MRKFQARVDANQRVVVNDLRKCGLSVALLHQLGGGIPDLLVGYASINWLVELKSTEKLWLTEDESKWHQKWVGQVLIANSSLMIVQYIYRDLKAKNLIVEAGTLKLAWEKKIEKSNRN